MKLAARGFGVDAEDSSSVYSKCLQEKAEILKKNIEGVVANMNPKDLRDEELCRDVVISEMTKNNTPDNSNTHEPAEMPATIEAVIAFVIFLFLALIGIAIVKPELPMKILGLTSAQAIATLIVIWIMVIVCVARMLPSYKERKREAARKPLFRDTQFNDPSSEGFGRPTIYDDLLD